MIKILIVSNNWKIGGIQKALINMLQEIHDKYDVTLLCLYPEGDYREQVPSGVKILNTNSFLEILACSQQDAKEKNFFWWVLRAICALWSRLFNNRVPFRLLMQTKRKITGFDYAISYVHSNNENKCYFGCNEFVLDRVEAKSKISYIHCDFLSCDGNTTHNKKIYRQFDKIITVSKSCKESFISAVPELKDRTYAIKNFNNFVEIVKLSNNDPYIYKEDIFNIVTVTRLSHEKGIIRCIPLIKRILEQNQKVNWHIVGGGPLEEKIKGHISDYKLEDNIILHGSQTNPYRFMKKADLFLLPSYHEAAPMVIDEAKCLYLPVLSTRTVSAIELIEDTGIGWVCENNEESIFEKLVYILLNREELDLKKNKMKRTVFNNQTSLILLDKMIENNISVTNQ